jgi:hypothetical protein
VFVTARLYGDLTKYATEKKPSSWQGRIEEGTTVADFFKLIGCPEKKVICIFRDGLRIDRNTILQDGNVFHMLTHLGGG